MAHKSITITESQKQILSNHANKQKPNEACAVLLGKTDNDKIIIEEIFLTDNIDESEVNFTISPEQTLQGYTKAEEKNLEVVGIFHSHPNSEALPSSTDQKFMQTNPYVWVIFSGIVNEFRAFVLESNVKEIPIV